MKVRNGKRIFKVEYFRRFRFKYYRNDHLERTERKQFGQQDLPVCNPSVRLRLCESNDQSISIWGWGYRLSQNQSDYKAIVAIIEQ
ncbi:MAG: hypothetical protein Q4C95_09550 [Planctomycetia bacterium]|nr:hypothetical protein [Planctomycetia bacterium]